MEKTEKMEIGNNSFEISTSEKDAIIIQRHFAKHTAMDLEIQKLPIPKKPIWSNLIVRFLRVYQQNFSEIGSPSITYLAVYAKK